MKTHPLPIILQAMATLMVLPACTTNTPAQAKHPAASTDAAPEMVGGFSPSAITKEVQKAAAFAVREQCKNESVALSLVAVSKAETQVVAGTNYRLTLTVKSGGQTRTAVAVVFKALDGHYELTSWTTTQRLSSRSHLIAMSAPTKIVEYDGAPKRFTRSSPERS